MVRMTQMQDIIRVFRKNGNPWLDYNEVYAQMNRSLFGPNKYGEAGQKRMVYRYLLGNEMFDEDASSRPKKFRLKAHVISKGDDPEEIERVYSTGEVRIFNGKKQFNEVKFSIEEEIEDEVKTNYKMIFGPDAVYYDLKKKIGNRICDAIVFNLKTNRLYIVENELFIHDLYGHIIPQIIEFFNGMRDEETKNNLKFNIGWNKRDESAIREAIDKSIYDVVVVMDRINFEIEEVQRNISELAKHFVRGRDIGIIFREFNVFIDDEGKKIFRVK